MALVPGILALAGIIFQPWFLLFIFLPFGIFIAPFGSTVITLSVYRWADSKGYMDWAKKIVRKIRLHQAIGLIGSILVIGGIVFYCGYIDFFSVHRKTPYVLKDFESQFSESHFYSRNSFIDSEYIWQARVSEEVFKLVVSRLELKEVNVKDIPSEFFKMPPYWWGSSDSNTVVAYSTIGFPVATRGGDGLHIFAVWDSETKILKMWVKDNF